MASALVWTGARISRREGRANLALVENIVGLIISGLILWAAVGIFRKVTAVAGAREDKSRIINEALGYMDETIPKARGDAGRLMLEAEGYRSDRIDRARGDSERFKEMARYYRDSKRVTETRLYLETVESLLVGIEKYIVSADIDLEGYDIRVFEKALSSDAVLQD